MYDGKIVSFLFIQIRKKKKKKKRVTIQQERLENTDIKQA